ncbi:MAG: HNH endonuclease [Gammaproteobacteria bacterium]|nr:HNH endonuclease [Gammaproteobacteria bacterium]
MATFDHKQDAVLRSTAFGWLARLVSLHGEVLPRKLLEQGFEFSGERVHVIGPPGIFRPRVMRAPLSITTSPNGPYDDAFDPSGRLRYRFRGKDPAHRDNQGLVFAKENRLPLLYFHGILTSRYLPIWPVYVVQDLPEALTFLIEVDDVASVSLPADVPRDQVAEGRRQYVTTLTRRRVHQTAFRERVLRAYRRQCAVCQLRHDELLDAAHIIPDPEPDGEPVVNNGLSLCRLHHAAFDRFFLGVRPDHVIEVRPDVLAESDGPTLRYAIQGLHGKRIALPRKRDEHPTAYRLEERYERFLAATAAG